MGQINPNPLNVKLLTHLQTQIWDVRADTHSCIFSIDICINRQFELWCVADNNLKSFLYISIFLFLSLLQSLPSLSTISFPHCLAGLRVMCHFIILWWLNYIRNILSLIKPAIGSTWDKTDYKSWEWKHRVWNAGLSTLWVCVCSWEYGEEEKLWVRERVYKKGTVKICWCAFIYRWCYSSETICLTTVTVCDLKLILSKMVSP